MSRDIPIILPQGELYKLTHGHSSLDTSPHTPKRLSRRQKLRGEDPARRHARAKSAASVHGESTAIMRGESAASLPGERTASMREWGVASTRGENAACAEGARQACA